VQPLSQRMHGDFRMSDVRRRNDQTIQFLTIDHEPIVGITVGDLETIADNGESFGAQVCDSD
jgi:hypothetical protein